MEPIYAKSTSSPSARRSPDCVYECTNAHRYVQSDLTAEERGRGLSISCVDATDGIETRHAVDEVKVNRIRVRSLGGQAGLSTGCTAEGRHLLDLAGASAHAQASSTAMRDTGHHRGRRKSHRAS